MIYLSNRTEGRRTVTIRGLSRELYERAVRLAGEMGVTVGEVVNEALRRYISMLEGISKTLEGLTKSGDVLVISNVSSLTVGKRDLEAVGKRVVFKDIDELVFGDDITEDLINEKVAKIVNVNVVSVPKSVSVLVVASRCEMVKKIASRG